MAGRQAGKGGGRVASASASEPKGEVPEAGTVGVRLWAQVINVNDGERRWTEGTGMLMLAGRVACRVGCKETGDRERRPSSQP